MSRLLYFTDLHNTVTQDIINDPKKLNLEYAFGRAPDIAPGTGPEGRTGCLFSYPGGQNLTGIQDVNWTQYPGRENLWIGLPKEPPKPSYFAREAMITGHEVEMGDKNKWQIPVARFITGENLMKTPLNFKMVFDGTKWVAGEMEPLHEVYFNKSVNFFNIFLEKMEALKDAVEKNNSASAEIAGKITVPDECELASIGIQINYRISAPEISVMGLIDKDVATQCALAAIDYPSLKKKF